MDEHKESCKEQLDDHGLKIDEHEESYKEQLDAHGLNVYLINIQCHLCERWVKYNKTQFMQHLIRLHSDSDINKVVEEHSNEINFSGIEVLEDMAVQYEEEICEICNLTFPQNKMARHIHWEHMCTMKTQVLLEKYYKMREADGNIFQSKTDAYGCNLEFKKKIGKKYINNDVCEFCNLVIREKKMETHLEKCREYPGRKKLLNCRKCNARVKDEEGRRKHQETCDKQPVPCCEICGKSFKFVRDYFYHRKYDHGIMTAKSKAIIEYPCDKCPRVFYLKCRLRHHMKVHSDKREYVCDICGSSYKYSNKLKRHIQFAHHNIYQYYCDKCGHGMNKKEQLRRHVCGRTRNRKKSPYWNRSLKSKELETTEYIHPQNEPTVSNPSSSTATSMDHYGYQQQPSGVAADPLVFSDVNETAGRVIQVPYSPGEMVVMMAPEADASSETVVQSTANACRFSLLHNQIDFG